MHQPAGVLTVIPTFGTIAEVDLGRGYRIDAPKAGLSLTGRYLTVEPPHRLVMTWQWAGEDDATLVTIDLAPDADGTGMTLTPTVSPAALPAMSTGRAGRTASPGSRPG